MILGNGWNFRQIREVRPSFGGLKSKEIVDLSEIVRVRYCPFNF